MSGLDIERMIDGTELLIDLARTAAAASGSDPRTLLLSAVIVLQLGAVEGADFDRRKAELISVIDKTADTFKNRVKKL